MALTNLGGLYTEARRFAEAEALYQDLVLVLEETFGPDSPAVADALNYQGLLYYYMRAPLSVRPGTL